MCYSFIQTEETFAKLEAAGFAFEGTRPSPVRTVFPMQPLIFGQVDLNGHRMVAEGQFGLVPGWVNEKHGGSNFGRNCYNARTESVFTKPSFRKAIAQRRAVVPVQSFFEFPTKEKPPKHRYQIMASSGHAFWLAAIWEHHAQYNLTSVSILTTPAMTLAQPFYDRSPLVLDDAHVQAWLDPAMVTEERIQTFFQVHDSNGFEAHREPWGTNSQGELFGECQ